jgi:hypothetical protein
MQHAAQAAAQQDQGEVGKEGKGRGERRGHAANAHCTESHPPMMKHAKSELITRPPSPLAGGYQSARYARPFLETSNKVFPLH